MKKTIPLTSKYLIFAVVLMLVAVTLLISFDDSHSWYLVLIPLPIIAYIIYSRAYILQGTADSFCIKGIARKKEFKYSEIKKTCLFTDPFFYHKTLGIRIYHTDESRETYYLGMISNTHIDILKDVLDQQHQETPKE